MKKRTTYTVCDRHRSEIEAVEQATIVVGKERRQLDLCRDCAAELRRFAGLNGKAKKKASPKSAPSRGGRRPADEAKAIRAWAAKNGHELPERGRIPAAVTSAWRAAGAPMLRAA